MLFPLVFLTLPTRLPWKRRLVRRPKSRFDETRAELRLDEDHQSFGQHAVELHRFGHVLVVDRAHNEPAGQVWALGLLTCGSSLTKGLVHAGVSEF
jgi:hypothetical protein